uniref:Putative secreted protein n=1 Tax=Anopheles darlingi TaxID=43151 RepID=A0A2M4DNX2_ANODA
MLKLWWLRYYWCCLPPCQPSYHRQQHPWNRLFACWNVRPRIIPVARSVRPVWAAVGCDPMNQRNRAYHRSLRRGLRWMFSASVALVARSCYRARPQARVWE